MLVIGIVGGVASGKSFVANMFSELGARVIDVDRLGHEVLLESGVKQGIRERWGDKMFSDDGHVDRQALARIVFAPGAEGAAALAYLEALTHPRIACRLEELIATNRQDGERALVLDAAVLMKANWDRFCDRIVFVDAPREERIARAVRRGWTEDEFSSRESAQLPIHEKIARADFVISNSSSPEHTYDEVRRFWNSLIAAT
jgi:dephospho-CoA kinase